MSQKRANHKIPLRPIGCPLQLHFNPLSSDNWRDFEQLFGPGGACGGCWCMLWRLRHAEYERNKGESNRRAMKKIIAAGQVPGILAYHQNQPIGWCAIGPREHYSRLQHSRLLQPIDRNPVWSIVCLFIQKAFRRCGVSVALVRAAVEYARERGASIVESYPVEPKKSSAPDVFLWTGLASAF